MLALGTLTLHNLKILGFGPLPQSGLSGLLLIGIPILQQATVLQEILESAVSATP
jgi:hypothetical protein